MLVSELMNAIYEDHYSHLEFIDNMGGKCICPTHQMIETIKKYWKVDLEEEEIA